VRLGFGGRRGGGCVKREACGGDVTKEVWFRELLE